MQRLPYPDPGVPDLRTPLRFLRWVARGQWRTLMWGDLFGVIWMVSQALFPAAVGQAIDLGIIAKDMQALLVWGGVLVGLGAVGALAGAMRHRFAVENWLRASFRCMQLIGYKAADTGEALPRRMPTGEVVATVASDSMRLGGLYDVSARFAGAIVSYVVVAVILLSKSRPLGLVVLIGVPVLVGSLSFIRRPHGGRSAGASWHRWRAAVPSSLPGAVTTGPRCRGAGGRCPGLPRRRPGAPARSVRRPGDLARRTVRARRDHHAGRPRPVLRLRRLPGDAVAHRHRVRRPRHPRPHRGPQDHPCPVHRTGHERRQRHREQPGH